MIQKRINSHREEIPLSCSWAYLSNFHLAALPSFSFGYWEDGYSPLLLPHKPLCNFSGAVTDVSQAPTGSLTCVCLPVFAHSILMAKQLGQNHTAGKWEGQDMNPAPLAPEPERLATVRVTSPSSPWGLAFAHTIPSFLHSLAQQLRVSAYNGPGPHKA